ncbi:MAG: hypothetical protein V2A54_14755 [Bacteroidota bacterium]
MQNATAIKSVDFSVFAQFARGFLNPLSKPVQSFRSSLQLIRSMNTKIVFSSSSKEETIKAMSSIDFTSLGYFNSSDYELNYEFTSASNIHSAIIKPVKVYPLIEDIKLPLAPDKKSKMYLDFLSDEFERVKIRAEKMLASATTERQIQLYASRNLQIARKLFHDASILFHSLHFRSDKEPEKSDVFIIYTLNLFVIRSIVFFSKFFKPYLSELPADEEKLRSELHNELPAVFKYPWLFNQRPALYQTLNSYMSGALVNDVIAQYSQSQPQQSASTNSEVSGEDQALQLFKGLFKLNCNTNIFLDVLFQFIHRRDEMSRPWLECEYADLIKLLSTRFTDKDGNLLNPASIRTIMKPANFKKRPHSDGPNKINISDFSPDDK